MPRMPRRPEGPLEEVSSRSGAPAADELGIGEGTVKSHASNVMLKLGVCDRTEAATAAIERGLVRLDS
jgi:two-component system NarL family response regulator